MKTLLLNPGPVNLSDGVRQALLGPDLCHREPEYFDMQQRVRDKLLQVYELDPATWARLSSARYRWDRYHPSIRISSINS